MAARLTFTYDREADILHIDTCLNPETGAVENLEVLFFSTRLLRSELFRLPVTAELWPASQDDA
jgi:hypothetical protein